MEASPNIPWEEAGKPERYVYTITEHGQQELKEWLAEPVEEGVERNELLLKLFFGNAAVNEINREHVRRFREMQSQLLESSVWVKAICATSLSRSVTAYTARGR